VGAGADLLNGLLAGNIGAAGAAQGRLADHLHQQGGLAHAGIAADQQGRARHHTAAADPVELRHAGKDARRRRRLGLKGLEHQTSLTPAGLGRRQSPRGARLRLLDHGVPGPAGGALAGPFSLHAAAGLADIDRAVSGQAGLLIR